MKISLFKRILLSAFAVLLCFGLAACGNDSAKPQTQTETDTAPTQSVPPVSSTENRDDSFEEELLGKIDTWRGSGESGKLSEADQFHSERIRTAKDLDPYRKYMEGFSAEDEQRILNEDGYCLMIEITGKTEYSRFGTSTVYKSGSVITVAISQEEADFPEPSHTFFLLYFSPEYYNGEIVDVIF